MGARHGARLGGARLLATSVRKSLTDRQRYLRETAWEGSRRQISVPRDTNRIVEAASESADHTNPRFEVTLGGRDVANFIHMR